MNRPVVFSLICAAALVSIACGSDGGGNKTTGAGGSTAVDRHDGAAGSGGGGTGVGGTGVGGSGLGGSGLGSGVGGSSPGGSGAGGTGPAGSGGGGAGVGGAGPSGDAGAPSGDGPSFNPPADRAVAKFCNLLEGEGMMVLEFTLELGQAPVQLTAKSGECAPAPMQPCAPIPVGQVPLTFKEGAELLYQGNVPVTGGTQLLFLATVDAMQNPVLQVGTLRADLDCSLVPLNLPDPGMGMGMGGADGGTRPPLVRP